MSFPAYRDSIAVDYEIIFIDRWASSVGIQVNERCDSMVMAILIVRHGVMGRIQKQFCNICFRQELLYGEPVIEKSNRIMSGSGAKERKTDRLFSESAAVSIYRS